MKKFLCSLFVLSVMGFTAKLQAQCDLAFNNLIVQPVSTVTNGAKCNATFNVSFDITTNSGFKYLFFHSWLLADYPSPAIFNCGGTTPAVDPGTNAELGTAVDDIGKSFIDFGFIGLKAALTGVSLNTPTDVTSLVATTYPHDNSVVLTKVSNSPGLNVIVTKTSSTVLHFDIKNLFVIINASCGGAIGVKTDIWGSNQNATDPKAQCYICGNAQFFNDPTISGFKNCEQPARKYSLGISTIDPTAKSITYKVYIDMNDNGSLDIGTDVLAFTSGSISISSSSPYSSGLVSLPSPYSNTQPYSEKSYLILVEGATLSNSILKLLPNPGCIPLPVDFKSFTATRNHSNVLLKWETSTEKNNTGFAVERNTTGSWEQVAWVATQAPGGNSNDILSYSYNDLNNVKGVSQYRIRQVDFDARSKYSEIRSVRGENQAGQITVYPNPSSDGKINIVFENGNIIRDVSVIDMNGRTVKLMKGVTSTGVTVDNLVPGMYTVRVVVPSTGDQTVEKIVVNKH